MDFDYKLYPTVTSKALTFDDIMLVPSYSEISSRLEPDVSTSLGLNIKLTHPILSTNMSSVTEDDMMVAMKETGGLGIPHRFLDFDCYLSMLGRAIQKGVDQLILCIGLEERDLKLLDVVSKFKEFKGVMIDVAHADCKRVHDLTLHISKNYSCPEIIVGNIATGEAYQRLWEKGATVIRVGIGGGKVCETRKVTGHGFPLLASLMDIQLARNNTSNSPSVIADGGIRNSGDIVKCLAFGADAVTMGTAFAGTKESPSNVFVYEGKKMKVVYGMSSKTAQLEFSKYRKDIAAEGTDKVVPYVGSVKDLVTNLVGGIRSGLSYSGARNIDELRKKFRYCILSSGSINENNR
jgi:IMP dehydrogenase